MQKYSQKITYREIKICSKFIIEKTELFKIDIFLKNFVHERLKSIDIFLTI